MVTLPYANNKEISDVGFLAAWNFWFNRFQPALDPLTDPMPRLAATEVLSVRLAAGYHFSLDIMCRMLAAPVYRNTAQAMPDMVDANLHLLEPEDAINPVSGRQVFGVRLTEKARELLSEILVDPALVTFADAWDDGDGVQDEDETPAAEVVVDLPRDVIEAVPSTFPAELIRQLVSDIETTPFTPTYRNRPFGDPVTGWRSRLDAYFWPRPTSGYRATCEALAPMLATARELAGSVGRWTPNQQAQAVDFAANVFLWGGVSQRQPYDWQHVEAVFVSAIEGRPHNNARMNSGWTKVAAFATAHLEPERGLVIWDSRVAHALIRRMDRILLAGGHRDVPTQFRDIGWVPGRGGSRTQSNPYILDGWRSGYQKWTSVFAASALVRAIRDELNARENIATLNGARLEPWTLRQVEMVLFMDGY